MCRKLSTSRSKLDVALDSEATELNKRDLQRGRTQTWKGFKYSLDNKLWAFQRETRALRRTIEQVREDNLQVERELLTLQTGTDGYRNLVKLLEELFSSDRWGKTKETAPTVRDTVTEVLKLAESKIAEHSKISGREKEMSAPLYDNPPRTVHRIRRL